MVLQLWFAPLDAVFGVQLILSMDLPPNHLLAHQMQQKLKPQQTSKERKHSKPWDLSISIYLAYWLKSIKLAAGYSQD